MCGNWFCESVPCALWKTWSSELWSRSARHSPRGLRVRWLDSRSAQLVEAIRGLPKTDTCPPGLFSLLLQNPCPLRKRTALVTELVGGSGGVLAIDVYF